MACLECLTYCLVERHGHGHYMARLPDQSLVVDVLQATKFTSLDDRVDAVPFLLSSQDHNQKAADVLVDASPITQDPTSSDTIPDGDEEVAEKKVVPKKRCRVPKRIGMPATKTKKTKVNAGILSRPSVEVVERKSGRQSLVAAKLRMKLMAVVGKEAGVCVQDGSISSGRCGRVIRRLGEDIWLVSILGNRGTVLLRIRSSGLLVSKLD